MEATNEYVETQYYKVTDADQNKGLVKLNRFWCDYAASLAAGEKEFLSSAFTDCCKSERESFLVICVLDLHMDDAEAHEFKPDDGRGVKITAASNLLMFKKDIKACELDLTKNDIMVIHRYQELALKRTDDGEEDDAPTEFLSRTAYTCEVVITNVSPKVKQFNLLYQVPEGAFPLKLTKYMKS